MSYDNGHVKQGLKIKARSTSSGPKLVAGDRKDFGHLFGRCVEGVKIVSPLAMSEIVAKKGGRRNAFRVPLGCSGKWNIFRPPSFLILHFALNGDAPGDTRALELL